MTLEAGSLGPVFDAQKPAHRPSRCLVNRPGVELRANFMSISHRCNLFQVAFVWELTQETICLPLDCLQGGQVRYFTE